MHAEPQVRYLVSIMWGFAYVKVDCNGKTMKYFQSLCPTLCVKSISKRKSTPQSLKVAICDASECRDITLHDVEVCVYNPMSYE